MARRKALCAALWLAAAVAGSSLSGAARAQEGAVPEGARPPVEGAAAAPGAAGRLADFERQIAELTARVQEWTAKAAEYEQARVAAPERLAALEAEIAAFQSEKQLAIPATATLEELTAQLLSAEQDVSLARKEASEVAAESALRAERRKRIPELLASAKERLQELDRQPAPAPESDPAIAAARQRQDALRREALEREIEAYQHELSSYDARGVLLGRRIDRANLRVTSAEARVAQLSDAVKSLQQRGAEREAAQARRSLEWAEALPPALQETGRKLAEANMQLAERRAGPDGLVSQIDDVRGKLARAENSVSEIEAAFANLESKIKAAGLTDSVGLLLRKQRADAADAGKYARFIRMRQELISSVQLEQIALREERAPLADIDALVSRDLDQLPPSASAAERKQAEALLHQLYETRRRYTDALIEDYETYFQKLVDFSAVQQQLIQKTQKLLGFIDERILWVPSSEAVKPALLRDGRDALAWFFEPRFWGQLSRALRGVAGSAILLNASVALLLLCSVPLARRLRVRIRELGEAARSSTCTHFAPTWEAFVLTLLLVPWLPGLLAYLGWQLGISPEATQFTRCFAGGLRATAFVWLTLQLPRALLRAGGVGVCHFGWPADSAKSLRRHLAWLTALAAPLVFLVFVFELRAEDAWKESAGRLAFVALMLAALVFGQRTLRAGGPLTAILRTAAPAGKRPWVWSALYYAALAVPVLLAAVTLRGYYWTALSLATRLHFTLFFLFGLLVVFQLLVRWSLLSGRRVAVEQARQRREALAARRQQQAAGELEGEIREAVEPELDLAAVRAQTSRLVESTTLFVMVIGLWLIWADVLPAVGILRDVQLWNVTETVTVSVTDASGVEHLSAEDRVVPVTLANLMLAILIAVLVLGMVRNLPGLLEVSLFRRLGVGAGERYAYATIVKYAVTIAGVALAFNAVGVGWSNIQWLIAAVGLGLGFGLQEIFANFVSGLIILFERPIRVGDTVTVADVSGTVTKIHIRATWIMGFDRKELVVPNKEFVTGRLINWSLSDPILRIDVPVGIAYGSDTDKAIEVLRHVAAETEHVLEDPPPQVLFLGFGDSALNFEVRVFSPDVAHLFPIRHQLHLGIDAAFRREGIEIAFPQRDVHLRSLPAALQVTSRGEVES